jgi:hypothetical protein
MSQAVYHSILCRRFRLHFFGQCDRSGKVQEQTADVYELNGKYNKKYVSEISGAYGGEYEDYYCLLGLPTFQRCFLPTSSGQDASETSVTFYHTTRHNNPEDGIFKKMSCGSETMRM